MVLKINANINILLTSSLFITQINIHTALQLLSS